jgi:GDPmannose 4,6-dehydratase
VRRAFITGVTGQDGSYLAELLAARGYAVHGLVHDGSHAVEGVHVHEGDLRDQDSLAAALEAARPDEVYNVAAASSVAASWEDPALTGEVTGVGVARLLEAVRLTCPEARVFHASSNEVFGPAASGVADETTPVAPRTPYGAAKAYAHHLVIGYREAYGLFCCNGILFNHDSPRRAAQFVTRKITQAAAEISLARAGELRLGTLDAQRDWGYAPDFVEAMWLMLQRDRPADYVLATGVAHSVRDCLEVAFGHVGLDWREHVRLDSAFRRPAETATVVGDASKARRELGWEPRTGFEDMIAQMVDHDLALLRS